jgi:hypothetical protein
MMEVSETTNRIVLESTGFVGPTINFINLFIKLAGEIILIQCVTQVLD